jgi:hypothetical protein
MRSIQRSSKRAVTAPPDDSRILDWFGEDYERVFCVLHPFTQALPGAEHLVGMEDGPSRDDLEKLRPVCWRDVMKRLGLVDLGKLHGLLLAVTRAVRPDDESQTRALARRLRSEELHIPSHGSFSPFLLDSFLASFGDLGFRVVQVCDEFGDRRSAHVISDLLDRKYPTVGEAHPSLIAPDCSLLYCVQWDAFYTFLCGEGEVLETIVDRYSLEGFFCDESTRVYWHHLPGDREESSS